jgi:ceroid-lipofuscinosis MFS transporter 7
MVLMFSVGYPIGHTALLGVFSKIMKSGPQGRLLGYFGSAGSFARVIFPLLAGVLTEFCGDNVIFAVMAALLLSSVLIYWICKHAVEKVIS